MINSTYWGQKYNCCSCPVRLKLCSTYRWLVAEGGREVVETAEDWGEGVKEGG